MIKFALAKHSMGQTVQIAVLLILI